MAAKSICKIDGCGKPAQNGRGWCSAHYRRWLRHGDPMSGRTPNGARQKFIDEVALPFEGSACLEWPFYRDERGYGHGTYPGIKTVWAHRIVCQLAHGEPPTPEHEAAHNCGVASCCNPRHLRWATQVENHADKRIHGTHPEGANHGNNRLSLEAVLRIRQMANDGIAHRKIAEQFGISKSHVSSIKCGAKWGHI